MKRRTKRAINQVAVLSGVTRSAPRMNNSSKTNGIATARVNGHPTIAPVAKSTVAISVRLEFCADGGARVYANANVLVYIANEDGRKARQKFIHTSELL